METTKMKLLGMVAVLMLIANSQCTPVDGVFDSVRDGIGGMLSHGRSLVFGENHEEESVKAGKPAVPSQGIVDRISLQIHDVSAGVRETVRNVLKITDKDTNENGKGIIKHVYDGVRNKVGKVKGLLFGITTQKPNENNEADDATKLKELVDKILANNNTSHEEIKNTYDVLNNALENVRQNITQVHEYDGNGLIDVRALDIEGNERNVKEYSNNAINGINAAYDKVEDDVSESYKRGKESFNSFRQNVADNMNSGSNYFKENIDKFAIDARSNFERHTN